MMRWSCAVISFVLLVAPASARTDDPPQPVPADGQCAVPSDPSWTKQEKFVWDKVCIGKEANFNEEPGYGGDLDPKTKALPESRILRSSFLETILLKDKYRKALTRLGVHITGARFDKKVDLSNAELRHDLWLDKSLFEQGADLTDVETTGRIRINRSKFLGTLYAAGAHIDKDLFLHETEFTAIMLYRSRIGGALNLDKSKVTGPLVMNWIRIDQGLFMSEEAEFNEVDLIGANIGDDLHLNRHSKVSGVLNGYNAQVGKIVSLEDGVFIGRIYLDYGKFGNLKLDGGTFYQNVDLTGAEIVGLLSLGHSSRRMNETRAARWPQNPPENPAVNPPENPPGNQFLILRNVKADAIQDAIPDPSDSSKDSWPPRLDLTGFTYHNLGALTPPDSVMGSYLTPGLTPASPMPEVRPGGPVAAESNFMTDRSVDWFKKWLDKQKTFSPQPYQQLATVLRVEGRPEAADKILYAGRNRERREVSSGLQYIWQSALWLIIGYGYKVWLSVGWLAVLLLVGSFVQWTRRDLRDRSLRTVLAYSLEMMLPVIRLRGQIGEYAVGWRDFYFIFHGLLGVVLVSFLAAGLAGLTK